jgi:hypothetical protein
MTQRGSVFSCCHKIFMSIFATVHLFICFLSHLFFYPPTFLSSMNEDLSLIVEIWNLMLPEIYDTKWKKKEEIYMHCSFFFFLSLSLSHSWYLKMYILLFGIEYSHTHTHTESWMNRYSWEKKSLIFELKANKEIGSKMCYRKSFIDTR